MLVVLVVFSVIILLGSMLGFTHHLTVYRDFNDLTVMFIGCALAFLGGFLTLVVGPIGAVLLVISAILLLVSLIKSFQDNYLLLLPIAFVTKIALSFLFLHWLYGAIQPEGDTRARKASNRNMYLIFLAMLTPLVVGLVKNRDLGVHPSQWLRLTR